MILVGCPVSNRAWILDRWFEHVHRAAEVACVDIGFAFAGSWHGDHPDSETLLAVRRNAPNAWLEHIDEPPAPGAGDRRWNHSRYRHMADVRNRLLAAVRRFKPHRFLSLDSDILIHPSALACMIETAERFDAVGGRCYLGPGVRLPSYAMFKGPGGLGGLRRQDANGVFKVDVIMAAKLMTPPAYNVDYRFHSHGEDAGWAQACMAAGVTLGWDGRVASKHAMSPEQLARRDPRVGW